MEVQETGKRIAVNTLVVYARVFVTMCVGLVTSRIVLAELGASDFGLYNVVGGVVAAFAVISGSLMSTTTRFVNVELGRQGGDAARVFSVSLVIHAAFALLILVLVEALGVPYVLWVLRVEPGRLDDAMFVFQVSVASTCVGVLNIPYQSLFVAMERFVPLALIETCNAVVRLALVLCIPCMPWLPLRSYAVIMSLTAVVFFVFFHWYAARHWPRIVAFRFVRERRPYRDIIVFNNYNLLSTAALVGRTHGSNMLINYFFSTVANAAYALAAMVQNYVNVFVSNFDTAAAPRITQSWSAGDRQLSLDLTGRVCRMCTLLMIVVYVPLRAEMDYVLHLWLGDNIPAGTQVLCNYSLLLALVSATSGGLTHLINVYGRIRWFKVIFAALSMACLVAGWLAFRAGLPPSTILLLFIVADVVNRVVQLFLLHRYIGLSVRQFVAAVYGRPAIVMSAMLMAMRAYTLWFQGVVHPLVGIVALGMLASAVAVCAGLRHGERRAITQFAFRYAKR
ncbi:MAG: hypothetical protein IJS59_06985 [Bacteroidaceae bacterium]|nr:hypothetical protein [Bacteroidaceae bacterium]